MTLLAFHGDPMIKEKYLARVVLHRTADELIKGVGWENGKGCAIGCTIEAYNHARYETELGIPEMLALLEDAIFEGLPNRKAQQWPERFLHAIRPGADLSLVGWKFLLWLFEDTQARYATDEVRKACEPVGAILREKAAGITVDEDSAWGAAIAAETAGNSVGEAWTDPKWRAVKAVVANAAWSATALVAASAINAANAVWRAVKGAELSAAANSADSSAAGRTAWLRMADKLVELLEAA